MGSQAGILPLVVIVAMITPAPATTPGGKSIVNPDFPCGEPYGPNGEPPERHRVKRQIIFPDDKNYHNYLDMLQLDVGISNLVREGETPSEDPDDDKPFCGVTPISEHLLVTAAHCVVNPPEPITELTLGDLDLTVEGEENSRAATYDIADIIIHPDYSADKPTRYNDIALIKSKQKIQFNDVVYPFCVSNEYPDPGTIVIISGFGYYNQTTRPDVVLEANFTVIDTKECEDIYRQNDREEFLRIRYPNLLQGSDVICAIDDESDSCQGDSGGPVVREKNGKIFLEGIVSGGGQCNGNFNSVLPGLYLLISKHIDFINKHEYGPPSPGNI